ncbi:GNAT family N-acetyltransferase [Aquibacillus rhizosphaerae]|uniref:GNAT family N-acetyltransferase n=1 Tax=Aquibacillus rhizosphaerae TaxID=3051431 RepID=A0ABT7LAQ3_9BACI|nr:GNAT family N-acetyltransferase [Aquibacillus sp. LR5S19]MDL4841630.1 GNAT family N-acetyltransferase [Aquibacillus sp. LR5S19]
MIKKFDIADSKMAEETLNIQLSAYMIEAKLLNSYQIPPLKDTVETLQQCGESFYGYFSNEELFGLMAIKNVRGVIDIHRLAVHPKYFRKGIAKMLLSHLENEIREATSIIVSTGSKNVPAIRFYERMGFYKT